MGRKIDIAPIISEVEAAFGANAQELNKREENLFALPGAITKYLDLGHTKEIEMKCPYCGTIHQLTDTFSYFNCSRCGKTTTPSKIEIGRSYQKEYNYVCAINCASGWALVGVETSKDYVYNSKLIAHITAQKRKIIRFLYVGQDGQRHGVSKSLEYERESGNLWSLFDNFLGQPLEYLGVSSFFGWTEPRLTYRGWRRILQATTPAKQNHGGGTKKNSTVTFTHSSIEPSMVSSCCVEISSLDEMKNQLTGQFLCNYCGHLWDTTVELTCDKLNFRTCKTLCPNCGTNLDYVHTKFKAATNILEVQETPECFDVISLESQLRMDLSVETKVHLAARYNKKTGKTQVYRVEKNGAFVSTKARCYRRDYSSIIIPDKYDKSGVKEMILDPHYGPDIISVIGRFLAAYESNSKVIEEAMRSSKLRKYIREYLLNDSEVVVNLAASSIADMFSMPDSVLSWAVSTDKNFVEIQRYCSLDPNMTLDYIKWAQQYKLDTKILGKLLRFGLTTQAIFTYLEDVRVKQCCMPETAAPLWEQYLVSTATCGSDLTKPEVLFPSALKTALDIVNFYKMFVIETPGFLLKRNAEFKKFEVSTELFSIKLPASVEELKRAVSDQRRSRLDTMWVMFYKDTTFSYTIYIHDNYVTLPKYLFSSAEKNLKAWAKNNNLAVSY